MPFAEFAVPNAFAVESNRPVAVYRRTRFQRLRVVPTDVGPVPSGPFSGDHVQRLGDDEVLIEEAVDPDALATVDETAVRELLHGDKLIAHRLPQRGVVGATVGVPPGVLREVNLRIEYLLL